MSFSSTARERLTGLYASWQSARKRSPRLVTAVIASLAAAGVCSLAFGLWFLISLSRGLPDQASIARIGEMNQSTTIYDDDDRLVFTIFKEQRIEVPLSNISPNLVHAILTTEDQRFYDHHGFDVVRIGAAALANISRFRVAQGGSTITQQLARQSFLTADKTIRRKLQELILAEHLERQYSKERILELYLNKVYFGDGLYGAEAASRGYFGKHASELSIPEAALLAGLVKSPSTYAPTISVEKAVARRNVVLQLMLDEGQIDRTTWRAAHASRVVLHDTLRAKEPHGRYFEEQVRRDLIDRFGWQRVYQGGLRVYSTIDMPMQEAAEASVAGSLKSIEARRDAAAKRSAKAAAAAQSDDPLQAALIALDPKSGHVRAMVGGRDFDESLFNRAVQARRQPGSAFKPFVYATAIEQGYTPATIIDHLNDAVATLQGAWVPEDEHLDSDQLSLRTALRTSSNRAAVRLLQQVGISRTVEYANRMGITDIPSVPSLALGSGEVTLQSLTAAYAAFANHGNVPSPILIRRVEDQSGHVLFEAKESPRQAISDTTAFLMATMMADVINAGTAAKARQLGFTLPAAGKTGTTNDFNDAWFVGFTPKLVAGVWVGFDQPHTILRNGFAAEVAVPLWASFMKVATHGDKPEWLTPPAGIVTANVCRLSGKLATEGCQNAEVVDPDGHVEHRSLVYTEYFKRGTEPTGYCDLHPTHGFIGTIASMFHGGDKPTPPKIADTGLAPAPPESANSHTEQPPPPETKEEPQKKRGFWGRLFGRK